MSSEDPQGPAASAPGGVLKSWGIPSRHHGCFNTKTYGPTLVFFVKPHFLGHLHMDEDRIRYTVHGPPILDGCMAG